MTFKPQKKPSAIKREHPALRNMGNFFTFSYCYGPFFALIDPDPADQNQGGSMRIRIRNTARGAAD